MVALLIVAMAGIIGSACSSTREVVLDQALPTAASTTVDPLQSAELTAGAGVDEVNALIDTFLATNDTCKILTSQASESNKFDPTLLTNPEARRALTEGLVKVYDHLVTISDASLKPALTVQKGVFVQVLDVVDRYASNPANPGSSAEIESLVGSSAFIIANQQLTDWLKANCRR